VWDCAEKKMPAGLVPAGMDFLGYLLLFQIWMGSTQLVFNILQVVDSVVWPTFQQGGGLTSFPQVPAVGLSAQGANTNADPSVR
jgi:hypothetical protein